METKKVRLYFTAHCSVVVETPVDDEDYSQAIETAQNSLNGLKGMIPDWEFDDGGVDEDVDDNEQPINSI